VDLKDLETMVLDLVERVKTLEGEASSDVEQDVEKAGASV
jgi:hypothetical protein